MALTPPVLLTTVLVMVVGIAHVYCSDTCQQKGTEWFQEDSETNSHTQLLLALNATIGRILQSEQTITHYPRDCTEILKQGNTSSGYYTIQPIAPQGLYPDVSNKGRPVNVYCDMDTDGGGWTVFQRRLNGVVGFDRDWKDYKHGFGYLEGDYWLGLENIHKLTTTASYELRIDLESFWANERYMYYAHYDQFHIKDEANLYKLYIGEYQGTAPDALRGNNYQPFITRDQNHEDNTCATERKGAWWYTDCQWLKSDRCGLSNLNGIFGAPQTTNTGMSWHCGFSCKDSFIIHVFKLSEMKIRRMDK